MIKENTWNSKNLEQLRMHNPYASFSELVDKMGDTAIQAAYIPISKSMARDAAMPHSTKERHNRQSATSLKEKKGYDSNFNVIRPGRGRNVITPGKIDAQRMAESTKENLKAIRAAGPKSYAQVVQEMKAQGRKPVRSADGKSVTFEKIPLNERW